MVFPPTKAQEIFVSGSDQIESTRTCDHSHLVLGAHAQGLSGFMVVRIDLYLWLLASPPSSPTPRLRPLAPAPSLPSMCPAPLPPHLGPAHLSPLFHFFSTFSAEGTFSTLLLFHSQPSLYFPLHTPGSLSCHLPMCTCSIKILAVGETVGA